MLLLEGYTGVMLKAFVSTIFSRGLERKDRTDAMLGCLFRLVVQPSQGRRGEDRSGQVQVGQVGGGGRGGGDCGSGVLG